MVPISNRARIANGTYRIPAMNPNERIVGNDPPVHTNVLSAFASGPSTLADGNPPPTRVNGHMTPARANGSPASASDSSTLADRDSPPTGAIGNGASTRANGHGPPRAPML